MDVSEIVTGLILNDRMSPHSVRSDLFVRPYDQLIKAIQSGTTEIEELIETVGLQPVESSLDAVKNMNGVGDANWLSILENSATNYDAGVKLEKFSRQLQRGDKIDWTQIAYLGKRALEQQSRDLVPLSQVKSGEMPFIATGWKAFDDHTMGIPETGLVIVGGNPGVGKTTWAAKLVGSFVKHYSKKRVAFFSIEMILNEIAGRLREVNTFAGDEEDRLMLCEVPVSPEEVLNIACTVDNLGLVVIDFADLMIKGETTESSMAHIYRSLMLGAKELKCPIVLLSQLNRYSGGLPKPSNIRYTGLAEALAWMILMLYNPATDWNAEDVSKDYDLPVQDNAAYVIVWKVRGGFRVHREQSPGAILIPFRGDKGWGSEKSKWFSLRRD